ncbi:MAG TPA: site-specific DNA-methyltransferase [Nitrososphaerales archaeon]
MAANYVCGGVLWPSPLGAILSSSRVGDVVLDPFIGSGTTAVVAKNFGRKFLGCDINPEYVSIAEERLKR